MSAGGPALWKKLGYWPGAVAYVEGAPPGYRGLLGGLPDGVVFLDAPDAPVNLAHLFATDAAALAARLPDLRDHLAPGGMLWVSWPKRTAKVPTDVTEDGIRAAAHDLGLVDVKASAVDATWGALKLVRRRVKGS